jgi:hypothetical protein
MPYFPNPAGIARLQNAAASGFRKSVYVARTDAEANRPSSKAGVMARLPSPTKGVLIPTGLGFVFEQGRAGGYPILPGGVKAERRSFSRSKGVSFSSRAVRGKSTSALKFTRGDGGFARSATGGAMRARPYIRPAAARWASGVAQRVMALEMARAGFGRR